MMPGYSDAARVGEACWVAKQWNLTWTLKWFFKDDTKLNHAHTRQMTFNLPPPFAHPSPQAVFNVECIFPPYFSFLSTFLSNFPCPHKDASFYFLITSPRGLACQLLTTPHYPLLTRPHRHQTARPSFLHSCLVVCNTHMPSRTLIMHPGNRGVQWRGKRCGRWRDTAWRRRCNTDYNRLNWHLPFLVVFALLLSRHLSYWPFITRCWWWVRGRYRGRRARQGGGKRKWVRRKTEAMRGGKAEQEGKIEKLMY